MTKNLHECKKFLTFAPKYEFYNNMNETRSLIKTTQFQEFYDSQPDKVKEKIDYVMAIMINQKVVSTKFVKRLENTEFYEMRVSLRNNEYRTILFTLDAQNFMECKQAILLNGFVKKDTKQYTAEIEKARTIIKSLEE